MLNFINDPQFIESLYKYESEMKRREIELPLDSILAGEFGNWTSSQWSELIERNTRIGYYFSKLRNSTQSSDVDFLLKSLSKRIREAKKIAFETIGANRPTDDRRMSFLPSAGEYMLWDTDLIALQLGHFREAASQVVPEQVVLDIGTGPSSILAKACADMGAKRIYTVRLLEDSYLQTKHEILHAGYGDKITVLHGDPASLTVLPEEVQICIFDLFGPIGTSSGIIPVAREAMKSLVPGGLCLPHGFKTLIAAVTIPDRELMSGPQFHPDYLPYLHCIFDLNTEPFDPRLCIWNMRRKDLISSTEIFEKVYFNSSLMVERERPLHFTIEKDSILDGFLLWVNIEFQKSDDRSFPNEDIPRFPFAFLPVFFPAIPVREGDMIEAVVSSTLSDDLWHPNYKIVGRVCCLNGENIDFHFCSDVGGGRFKHSPFYQALFPSSSKTHLPKF